MKKNIVSVVAALLLVLMSGCQKNNGTEAVEKSAKPAEISMEPVTLKFMVAYGGFTKEEFQSYFVDQVKKKYPHITIEMVTGKLEDMITANDVPDILMSGLPGIPGLQELKIIEGLNPYIKKYGLDLSKFDPIPIEAIRRFDDKGEMLALPFRMNIPALFYNKDIFDKFGISYPQDGITWDETISLANKLTRNDGNTQYLGLHTGGADRMAMGLSLPYVNKLTSEASLETDGWQSILNLFKSVHTVPGYINDGKIANTYSMFLKEKNVAMTAYWGADIIGDIDKLYKSGQEFNWDMVTIPTFEKGKGVAWQAETHNLIVTNTSKHKEQAFQVLSYIASDEVQSLFNKSGRMTVLKKTEEIKKDYGSELPFLNGKNTNAFFVLQPGMHEHTKFDQKGRSFINGAASDMLLKGIDVNTALRTAQENLNRYIQDQNRK
ncbi:ABC transporter substrate-binding protein [Paenibacillus sp. UNC451MF]|uniref:ABC transporter substrate-binding protein n=1 Tax=Paenibacillus sp. UNC451MF TaxID=1449063 RepID=UPI00048D46FD|nr:extracellular solute-binding protein [Paenibacillus sp. UNC451MF]